MYKCINILLECFMFNCLVDLKSEICFIFVLSFPLSSSNNSFQIIHNNVVYNQIKSKLKAHFLAHHATYAPCHICVIFVVNKLELQ